MSNNKQQTAIQELINELISRRENIIKNSSSMSQDMLEGGVMAFESTIDLAQSLLEMEKEKLEDAWVEGFKNWNPSKTFEQYYNETYGGGEQ